MEKKKVIVMLSRVFPAGHPKAGQFTDFDENFINGTKIHTIRWDAAGQWEDRAKAINEGRKILSVRQWTGRPYNSKQVEIARKEKIGLQRITLTYGVSDLYPQVWVDGKPVSFVDLAHNDGLDPDDLVHWYFDRGNKENTFEGVIVHFTNFRY